METIPIVLQLIVIWLMLGAINQTLKRIANALEQHVEDTERNRHETEVVKYKDI